jgi:Flp pilus assembly protein TadD
VARAAELEPNNPDILDTLGWLKLQQKQVSDSVSLLERAHKLRPDDGQISYHLVLALNSNGQRDQARRLLNALLASKVQFGDLPEAQKLRASLH